MSIDAATITEPVRLAEEQILGAVLQAPVMDDLRLSPEDFAHPRHGLIWAALRSLHERGAPLDIPSVALELGGDLERAGGRMELLRLYSTCAVPRAAAFHAQTVIEASKSRRLAQLGEKAQQLAGSGGPIDDRIQLLRDDLDAIDAGEVTDRTVGLDALFPEALADLEAEIVPGASTGLVDLDHVLTPLLPGQFLVVAARPGQGKSALLTVLARNYARAENRVLLCSLEMGRVEVMHRLIATSGVPLTDLERKTLDDRMLDRTVRTGGELSTLPLWVDDREDLSLSDLRALCRRYRPTVLLVDYLQLMRAPQGSNRQESVAALSRGLKLLAKQCRVGLVVAAQLNRGPESRMDKKPLLSDLRESGAIEQDADKVLLLHRPEGDDRFGELDIIIAKQRNGPTGVVPVGWQGPYARVADLARRM